MQINHWITNINGNVVTSAPINMIIVSVGTTILHRFTSDRLDLTINFVKYLLLY